MKQAISFAGIGTWLLAQEAAAQQPMMAPNPAVCQHVGRCKFQGDLQMRIPQTDAMLYGQHGQAQQVELALQQYLEIAERYFLEPGDALDCRGAAALVFWRLADIYRNSVGANQRAHNLYQLAMSMFWDMSREQGGIECLETGRIEVHGMALRG